MNPQDSGVPREASLRLQVSGTLIPGRDIYVRRPEDEQLFELLSAGEYVNILSSRQVGKSSLVMRTAFRLRESGHRFAYVDLTSLGTPDNGRSYFRGLIGAIAKQLAVKFDVQEFWRDDGDAETNTQQFIRFFRECIATQIDTPVLICLDEIDSTLKFSFTDDLFTALRSMYNERAIVQAYQRITFCLVGVATPDELIKDRRTTPYNVGKTLWVGDFDAARDDLALLERKLSDDATVGQAMLQQVLHWTGGHPHLTTKLCQDLRSAGVAVPGDVGAFAEQRYRTLDGLGEDVHFQQILRFLKERLSAGLASFNLYESILEGKKERDQPSLAYTELKLSGLVKRDENGFLVTRNRIYERLFNLEWVQKSRPKQEIMRARRFGYAAAAALVVALISGGVYYQTSVAPLQQRDAARSELQKLQVTLIDDSRGWTQVRLPARGRGVLESALPYLETLSNGPDAQELSLDLSGVENVNLNVLAPLTGLRRLNISGARDVAGLVPLRRLTELRQLTLMETGVTNLGPLAALTQLEELDISRTSIDDLAPLAQLSNLKRLSAAMTPVANLAPLRSLGKLEALDVSFTKVRDLTPLTSLEKLQQLNLSNTDVTDLVPLGKLTALRELDLSGTKVRKNGLTPLEALTRLRTLTLGGTGIRDFNADARIAGLKVLQDPAPRKSGAPYQAGDSFRDCPECPEMVVVPAGSFVMGSPSQEPDRQPDEGPQRTVTIARAFAVGKFEVRFDEWMQCVLDEECRMVWDESYGRGPRPVVNFSWNDAKRYIAWLAKKTGKPYRLLTEAEWEYAARAGTSTSRYWGNAEPEACRYANVADRTAKKKFKDWTIFDCDDSYTESAPVGTFRPNAFGLYDMLGNAWEWVEDCWHSSYTDAPADASAWVTNKCASRVIRGGGWYGEPGTVRSAVRLDFTPEDCSDDRGFRVARTLSP